jgi:hypothetical protein
MTATRQMPARGHSTAPTFDGNALNLNRFFDEVDLLAEEAKVDDRGKIKHSLRYASIGDYELWIRLPAAAHSDFSAFRKEVLELYPGAEDDRRYTISDLNRLTSTQANYGIRSRAELGEYYREFYRIAEFLKEKNRLSERELNIAYEAGFDHDLRTRVKTRMQYSEPDHFHDDPYDFKAFHKCAHFLLAGTAAEPFTTAAPRLAAPVRPTPEPVVVKTESTDPAILDLLKIMAQQMTALTQSVTQQHKQPAPPPPVRAYTPAPFNTGTPSGPQTCRFCDDPSHLIRDCQLAIQYIKDGKCTRDQYNRLVLPNGMNIPRHIMARTLRERFDIWHAQNPGNQANADPPRRDAPPHLQSNLVEVVEVADEEAPPIATNHVNLQSPASALSLEEEETIRSFEAEINKIRNKKARFDGVEIPQRPSYKDKGKGPASNPNTSGPSNPKPALKPFTPTSAPQPNPITASLPRTPPTTYPLPQMAPQYRYQAPIEDPNLAKEVAKQILDSTVSTTAHTILAISPDVRKHTKELLTPRKITTDTNAIEVFHQEGTPTRPCDHCDADLPMIVADDAVPLRAIYPTIDGKYSFECVVDHGSMIVGMNRNIWNKLGLGLQNSKVRLTSANASHNDSIGRLANLRFTIGEIDFYLQVQVMEDTAYEVLLGRPFMKLMNCITQDYPDGNQTLTITDPNTGKSVIIPTVEHCERERRERSDTRRPGF